MDRWQGHYRWSARAAFAVLGPLAGAVVLDVGGGTGGVAARLAARGARVVVLDRSRGLVYRAARRVSAAVVCDAAELPCRSGGADVILLCQVLHHVAPFASALDALREAHRALRPGGRLLVFELTPPATRAARLHLWFERLLFGPIRCWPRRELLNRLARLGYTTRWPAHATLAEHYVVLAEKSPASAEAAEEAEEPHVAHPARWPRRPRHNRRHPRPPATTAAA